MQGYKFTERVRRALRHPPSLYNFTERVRRILAQARSEAMTLQHDYVGPEHVLLALLAQQNSVSGTVLQNLGVDLPYFARSLKEKLVPGNGTNYLSAQDLPYTKGAKKTLSFAMIEARDLNHSYVGSEHLLLGILLEGNSPATKELNGFGVTIEKTRAETLRVLLQGEPLAPPTGEKPVRVYLVARYSNGAVVAKNFESSAEAARFLDPADVE